MPSPYRSKFEATVHKQIPSADYEPTKIRFVQPAKARTYKPDFILPNGIIIEAKGIFDAADREKMLWVKDQHPALDIRFIFQRSSNLIRKRSKTTYAMWCDKHGFPWVEKTVPDAWLNEPPKHSPNPPKETDEAFTPC